MLSINSEMLLPQSNVQLANIKDEKETPTSILAADTPEKSEDLNIFNNDGGIQFPRRDATPMFGEDLRHSTDRPFLQGKPSIDAGGNSPFSFPNNRESIDKFLNLSTNRNVGSMRLPSMEKAPSN